MMDPVLEETLIRKCLAKIEQDLGWEGSEGWATQDFEELSRRIQQSTGVSLSVATLKRVWGKIRYDSRPTVTTLDAIARFAGYGNWRGFRQSQQKESPPTSRKESKYGRAIGAGAIVIGVIVSVLLIMGKRSPSIPDPGKFSFSSKKVIDIGVPNSVIFDYDAGAAAPDDSVFIQQSWDKRLSRRVSRDDQQHTSIYYYPGYFEAKLVINGHIVKEHKLLIKTQGWLPLIAQSTVPVYFSEVDAMHDGMLQIPLEKISASNIALQPVTPWVGYYNIQEFNGVQSGDMILETEVRSDYREGTAACQFAVVRMQFDGPALEIPLSTPGCVSELDFAGSSGKKTDLSAFGADMAQWVSVRCVMNGEKWEIFVNNKSASHLTMAPGTWKLLGVSYRFQGTGSVNFLRLSKVNGEVLYEDQF